MRELQQALEAAAGRVVVIAGAGPAFSAGHDLKELTECEGDEAAELFATCSALMTTVQSIPQPVIAQVHGVATAAGCQLVASCDLAIADDRRPVRHARRAHRVVLLHADGAADADRSGRSAPCRCSSPAT